MKNPRIFPFGWVKLIIADKAFPATILCCAVMFGSGCQKKKEAPPPPPTVEVTPVVQKDIPIQKEWVGALDGYVNAVIRPQVTGYLIKQNYKEGDFVRKGQTLFMIDPRTFKATLDKAKAELAQQRARHQTAKANLARIKPLVEKNALSRKDLDDAVGMELSTRSSVEAAQAAVEEARLNLEFTRITSPIDGIAGIAKAQLGDLVSPDMPEELTSVSTVNPIKAYVNISEREYLRLGSSGVKPENIPLQLVLVDGSVFPQKGRLALADRQFDPTTGTMKVGALFPNPGNKLRPGAYCMVRATTTVRQGALLVPQRAVTDLQGRNVVAVVGGDNKADIRPVKVAERIGSDWIVEQGVKPGEKVVVEGTQKVKPGQPVTPKLYAATEAPPAAAGAAAGGEVPPPTQENNTTATVPSPKR